MSLTLLWMLLEHACLPWAHANPLTYTARSLSPCKKGSPSVLEDLQHIVYCSQDALVPAFPSFSDEGENKYTRRELEYVL
eukprot:m.134031 g.134031  ORF g.134031 m.134031 type:complete len:80 (-) comp9497_c0_seq2:462-701(-)